MHPNHRTLLTKVQTNLQALNSKLQINPHIHQLWWLGLLWTTQNPVEPKTKDYPPQFHHIIKSQSKIGWYQLFYGRISMEWLCYFQHHSSLQINGTQYLAQVLTITWTGLLQIWHSRNTNNQIAMQHHPDNMESDLNGIFSTRHRLSQLAQDQIFNHTCEELESQSKEYINKWITNSTTYI